MAVSTPICGRTVQQVTVLGFGEGSPRIFGKDKEAYTLINGAPDLCITYCESASVYSGSEGCYGEALVERQRVQL